MKIIGITRLRNESPIINNTLDHAGKFCDEIFVYDDCSTDNTARICGAHPKVKGVILGERWESEPSARALAEGIHRQKLYRAALDFGADWVYCFDGDDYAEWENLDFKADCYYLRNFDYYITPNDIETPYLDRKWIGPEYRDVPVLFRSNSSIRFTNRVPKGHGPPVFGGYNRHYGKATTVEAWDEACDYYINHRWKGISPELQQRWRDRKGKAIHTKSDFGRELIRWEDRKTKGVKL